MDELEVLQHYCYQASQGLEVEANAKEALTKCFEAANRFDYVKALAQIKDEAYLSFIYKAFIAVGCKVKLGFLKKRLIEHAIIQSNLLVLRMFFTDGVYRSLCPVDTHVVGAYTLTTIEGVSAKPLERSFSVDSMHSHRITYSQSATAYYKLQYASKLTQEQQAIVSFLTEKVDPLSRQRVQVSKSEGDVLAQPLTRSVSDNALHHEVKLVMETQTLFLPFWFAEQKSLNADETSAHASTSMQPAVLPPPLVAPKPVRAVEPLRPATPPRISLLATDIPSPGPKSPSLFTSTDSPTYRPGSPFCGASSPLISTPPASPFRQVY